MEGAFFMDSNGNMISCDTISSHIGLANKLLEEDEQLREEFKNSKRKDIIDFLILDKGYVKVSNIGYYRNIVYHSGKISQRQRELVYYYKFEEGFNLDDLRIRELEAEKEER